MARNGREREPDDLRREAAERLAAVKRTAAALEDRLRERTDQLGDAFDRTRDQLHQADGFVHRHRYWFIGGAVGVGLALARRGGNRLNVNASGGDGVRYILVERSPRPGVVRSLLGGVAALALRQGVSWLGSQLDGSREEGEPLLLPAGRRSRGQ
jgi:hypothetical protein